MQEDNGEHSQPTFEQAPVQPVPPPAEGMKQTIQVDFQQGQVTGVENTPKAGGEVTAPQPPVAEQPAAEPVPAAQPVEGPLTVEQEERRQQLIADCVRKTGGDRINQAGVSEEFKKKIAEMQDLPLHEVEKLPGLIDEKASGYREHMALKLVKTGEDPVELAQQLEIIDLELTDLSELHDWVAGMPDNNPQKAQEHVAQGIKNISTREVMNALGDRATQDVVDQLNKRFDQIYNKDQDLEAALAYLVTIQTTLEAGLKGEDLKMMMGLAGKVEGDQAVDSNDATAVQLSPEQLKVQQQLRDRILFALAGWAKSSIEESSASRFIDAFFGHYDGWGGHFGHAHQEAWKAPEGMEAVKLEELKEHMEDPKEVAKALLTAYDTGFGSSETALKLYGLKFEKLNELKEAAQTEDQDVVKFALNEVVKWMFEGTTDKTKPAQAVWNSIFPKVLFNKDRLMLGEEGMRWFLNQYSTSRSDRWADLTWPAVQEQAAVAA